MAAQECVDREPDLKTWRTRGPWSGEDADRRRTKSPVVGRAPATDQVSVARWQASPVGGPGVRGAEKRLSMATRWRTKSPFNGEVPRPWRTGSLFIGICPLVDQGSVDRLPPPKHLST